MDTYLLIPLEDTVVFPNMNITLPIDVGDEQQVLLVPTHEGARNGVVTKDGTVYLAHSQLGKLAGLVVVSPSKK